MLSPRFLRLRDFCAGRHCASRAEQPHDATIVHDHSTFPFARRTANGFQRLAEPSALPITSERQCFGAPVSHSSRAAGEKPLNRTMTGCPAYLARGAPALGSDTL